MKNWKFLSIWIQGLFYLIAGINHFINPSFYLDLIPPYLGDEVTINVLAGLVEIVLGVGLVIGRSRKLASYGLITMLIAFIPSHVYFIQIGSCVEGGLCVSEWIGWFRLIIIHPILLFWAWSARRY